MSTKADQLIEAAIELFDERGYHATGIDAILARAGVAKMTLYKHFPTKDALILAALREADQRSRSRMIADIERRATDPKDRLLALFDFASDWVSREEFRGCLFIRASGEFPAEDDPVRAACAEHAAMITRYLTGLGVQAGVREPEVLARTLVLLFTGVLAAGQTGTGAEMARTARDAARTLIDMHLAPETPAA
jgi:AcrR family transcriptional regulator